MGTVRQSVLEAVDAQLIIRNKLLIVPLEFLRLRLPTSILATLGIPWTLHVPVSSLL